MEIKDIRKTLKKLETQIDTAYEEKKIPKYGPDGYVVIQETLSILRNEIDSLAKK